MSCSLIKKDIDNYLDNLLDEKHSRFIDSHITHCHSCQQLVTREKDIRQAIKSTFISRPPKLDKDFQTQTWETFRSRIPKDKSQKTSFFYGFIAASILITAVFLQQYPLTNNTHKDPSIISFEVMEKREIHLVFTSEKQEDSATFTLSIPDNFHYVGRESQKLISWVTPLNKGKNVLTIPLEAQTYGEGILITRVKIGDAVQTFKIHLKT